MLESMAEIEGRAYKLLWDMGARPRVSLVCTAGGGAANAKWTELRARAIGAKVVRSTQGGKCEGGGARAVRAAGPWTSMLCGLPRCDAGEAAYGAALLARRGVQTAAASAAAAFSAA